MRRRFVLAYGFTVILLVAGCGRRAAKVVPPTAIPDHATLYQQGLAAFHEGTPEAYARAADAFRMASRIEPNRCEYALNLAQSLWFLATEQLLNWQESEPRQTEARAVVDSTASRCMLSHEAFTLRLRALTTGGRAATDPINRAVQLDPNDAMNWLVLAYLDPASPHLVTSDGSGKWVALTRAVELKPDSALIQYELGKTYGAVRGKETESRRAFERAIELNPRHFRAYLGLAYSAEEGFDVEPLYQKVVEIAPDFLEGRIALGSYYSALDEIEKAAAQYSAALAIYARYDIAEFRLGLLMLQAEREEDAERHFKAVVDLNPGSYEAYYYLGNIAYGRRDFEQAKNHYAEALKIRTNYAEAEYGIGHIYRQEDQTDLALAQFDKVIKLQPRYGDAYLSRGDTRAERREFAAAIQDYQKAIATYEDQIRSLNAAIAYADAHSQSRVIQSQKRRDQRDKARVEALLERARRYKSEIEENLSKVR